jgi:hypothetical protein
VKKGDRLELRIASVRDGIHLSKGIKVHGAEALDLLRMPRGSSLWRDG